MRHRGCTGAADFHAVIARVPVVVAVAERGTSVLFVSLMKRRIQGLLVLVLAGCGGQASPAATPPPETQAPASSPTARDAGSAAATAPSEEAAKAPGAAAPTASAAAPPAASAAPPEPPPRTPLAGAMREHFKDTETIRAAVIHGPLSKAVAPAKALVDLAGDAQLPPAWQPWAERVKEISSRISASPDVSTTAAATADIGLTCGGCHSGGKGPRVKEAQPPPAGDTLVARMKRHSWATERLWEGLYVPSEASWRTGVAGLEGGEFPPDILKKGGVHARTAASQFKALVTKAKDQKTPEGRASVYAALLETCASCHLATGQGR